MGSSSQFFKKDSIDYFLTLIAQHEVMEASNWLAGKDKSKSLIKRGTAQDSQKRQLKDYYALELARYLHDDEMLERLKRVCDVWTYDDLFYKIERDATLEEHKQEPRDFTAVIAAIDAYKILIQSDVEMYEAKLEAKQDCSMHDEIYQFWKARSAAAVEREYGKKGCEQAVHEAIQRIEKMVTKLPDVHKTLINFMQKPVTKKSLSFNTKDLQMAYQILDNHRQKWNFDQRVLFWNHVIAPLQKALPDCYQEYFYDQRIRDTFGKSYRTTIPKHQVFYTSLLDEDRFSNPSILPVLGKDDFWAKDVGGSFRNQFVKFAEPPSVRFKQFCDERMQKVHQAMELEYKREFCC